MAAVSEKNVFTTFENIASLSKGDKMQVKCRKFFENVFKKSMLKKTIVILKTFCK